MNHATDGIAWRKSTRSGTSGGGCVEVGTTWRKSSHSGSSDGDHLEDSVASRVVVVRDTMDRAGATLAVPPGAWRAFTSTLW